MPVGSHCAGGERLLATVRNWLGCSWHMCPNMPHGCICAKDVRTNWPVAIRRRHAPRQASQRGVAAIRGAALSTETTSLEEGQLL